jgi:hypothetical protein
MTLNSAPVGAGAILVLGLLIALVVTGCKSTDYAPLKQSLVAEDAAVVTTTSLLTTTPPTITKADAAPILAGAKILLAADIAWKAALDAKNAPATATAAATVSGAETKLLSDVNALATRKGLIRDVANGSQRLTGTARPTATAPDEKQGVGEITAVLAIIQLVADLSPKIVAWINSMSAGGTVTSVEVQTYIDLLTRDIGILQTAAQ